MNEFIEFRNHIYDSESHYIYPLLFLDNYINKNKTINSKESILIKRIQTIKQIERKNTLSEKDIHELCLFLGDNPYIDRFIVDTILKFFDSYTKKIFEKKIKDIISEKECNSQKLYHVLDLCIECDMDLLDDSDILFMLQKYKLDLDIMSILMDYIDSFKRDGFKDYIYKLLTRPYPDNIKIQMLNLLVNLYTIDRIDEIFVKTNIRCEKNKLFCDSYINSLNTKFKFKKQGISILQSMFYGDFEDSGKGNNGGLAVLLKDLGDEISKDSRVSFVFTITITEKSNKAFISYYGEKHIFIRLPIYLDQSISDPFIKRELFIKRYVGKFLKKADIDPHIFHIRYLDNASKAIADLSKELNKKLVFTLTPDPHRNMFDGAGNLKEMRFKELIEKLNKIKIGDELICKSDGIVGIGDTDIKKELEIYFPQFKDENIKRKIKMIGEGIQIDKSINYDDTDIDLNELMELSEINTGFFERPIILNVGRLSIQKGQIELLKAWSNSRLSGTHNLLMIGGDLEKPNEEEAVIINFFKDYLEKYPELKGSFFHKGAMSNEKIRLLEKVIIQKDFDLPHIYLCSSIKEEFGIAILEAMSKGFLTIGPIKGGVKTYIKNGKNGFLIDTSNWETIANGSEEYIYDSKIDKDKFKKIQAQGRKTVDENFSMKRISNEFLSFYLSLKGAEDDKI
ncbi:glycosyltransferase [Proteocatella sphenisci]|uniref:glycosyltransferase n=1 Tax=Proteocatella sphenisci TaxID=181070 RepID=UPI0004B282F6|nr:glycosyltransferase [Proteocatella sphenisci]